MYKELIVYEFPYSQNCMECIYSEFILLDDGGAGSDQICNENCKDNDGVNCPKKVLK